MLALLLTRSQKEYIVLVTLPSRPPELMRAACPTGMRAKGLVADASLCDVKKPTVTFGIFLGNTPVSANADGRIDDRTDRRT